MIRFACPTCGKHLKATDDKGGGKTNCPQCGQRLQVPSTERKKTILGMLLSAKTPRASIAADECPGSGPVPEEKSGTSPAISSPGSLPPPVPRWFYARDNKSKFGPVSLSQLVTLAKSGHLLPTDMVWQEGTPKWIPASTIQGLFPLPASPAGVRKLPIAPSIPAKIPKDDFGDPLPSRKPKVPVATRVSSKRRSPGNVMLLVGLGGAALFLISCFACCGFGFFGSAQQEKARKELEAQQEKELKERETQEKQAAKQELDSANSLWDSGRKTEAVVKYKRLIDDMLHRLEKSDQSLVLQRSIDFDAENGDSSSAKQLIEIADQHGVRLALRSDKAKTVMVAFQKEKAEKEAAELARKKEEEELARRRAEEEQARTKADEELAKRKEREEKSRPKKGVTRENYDRIKEGMTLQDVEALLGPGKESASASNVKVMIWQGGIFNLKAISITFGDNRVLAKAILD